MSEMQPGGIEYLPTGWILVADLKSAVLQTQAPLEWNSVDGHSAYSATPLGCDVNYEAVGQMPPMDFAGTMNAWLIKAETVLPDSSEVLVQRYALTLQEMLAATTVTSIAIYDDEVDNTYLQNAITAEIWSQFNAANPAATQDVANVMNALHDLKPIVERKAAARETLRLIFEKVINQ
jgi:hypothetical protein